MRKRTACWLGCFAAISSVSRFTFAAEGGEARIHPVTLEYTVVAGCPSATDLRGLVADRLGHDPFRDDAPDRVLVVVRAAPPFLEGRMEWRKHAEWAGDQNFPWASDDCRELVHTMALALAVQIHLLALEDAPEESSRPSPERAAEARPSLPAAGDSPKVARTPERSKRAASARWGLGAGASLGLGFSSSPIALGRGFGRLDWPALMLELGAEIGTATTTRRADGAGFSQQPSLVTGAGCGIYGRLSACLVTKGGWIRVAGRDVDVPASPTGAILLAGLRLGLRQDLGAKAFLEARAEGLGNLMRWTITLDQIPVWTAPPLLQTLGVDFGIALQ